MLRGCSMLCTGFGAVVAAAMVEGLGGSVIGLFELLRCSCPSHG